MQIDFNVSHTRHCGFPGFDGCADILRFWLVLQAHTTQFLGQCAAQNTNGFTGLVNELNAEELLVVQQAVKG